MQHRTSSPAVRNWKVFVSVLISYLMLIAPLASVSAATVRSRPPQNTGRAESQQPSKAETQYAQTPASLPAPSPQAPEAINITATKDDSFPVHPSGKAEPGDVINYTVTINNTGSTDATGVSFNDTIDPNTSFVANSAHAQPQARSDTFTTVGNTLLEAGVAASGNPAVTSAVKLFDNDSIATSPDTIVLQSFQATSANGGTVSVNADGSFTYLPAANFTGSDTFTYTVRNSAATTPVLTDTATVTITVSSKVWFVNSAAAGGGDGRSSTPFNSLASVSGATGPDAIGDIIYLFSSASNYTGGITLLNNQQLIGGGIALVVNTFTLKAAGTRPNITNAGGNGVTLASGNTLNGFNVGDTSGIDITGSAFGTLTVNNVALNGTGRPLNLTTSGTLAATFDSIASTSSSGGQGINIAGAGGSMTVTGGTTITNPATQCILVGTTTANIDFGNTSCTGGSDGVSLQNNSAGTRTFGTLSISGGSGVGFLHGVGGGAVSVTGATTITNPGGTGIDVQNSNANLTFAATTLNKGATGGVGVNLVTNTSRIITFGTLAVTTSNGAGLNATGGGTINVTTGAGSSISATGVGAVVAPAINANGVTLGANFTTISSTNSGGAGTGITLANVGGTLTVNNGSGTSTTVTNPGGTGIDINNSSVAANFGNTVVNASGGTGVSLATNSGALTFADFDIAPDSGQRALLGTNNSGTITSTSGTLATTNVTAVSITGASAASRTPLNMTLTSVSAAASGGNPGNGIELVNTNGPSTNVGFVVNGDGSNTVRGGNSTGGTIAATVGADGATTGIGIRLNTVDKATFRRMTIAGQPNFAVKGDTVSNITIEYTTANGTNGTVAPEGSFIFDGLTGAASINGCNIANSVEDNVRVRNSTGTLNRLVINNCGIGANSTTTGGDGVLIVSDTTAVVNVTVSASDFTSSRGDLMQTSVTNTATLDLILTGSHFSNNNAGILAAGGGTTFGGSGTGTGSTFTYNINNNTFRDAVGIALNINHTGGIANSNGRIENNVIGVVGVANSGSTTSDGIAFQSGAGGGTHVVLINNNQVRNYNNHGILLQFGDQQGIAKSVSATVTNNTVNTPGTGPNTDYNGLHVNNGTVSTDNFTSCIDIRLNNLVGSGKGTISPNNQEFRLRQRQSTTIRLPGYGGANNNDAAVVAFIQGQNTVTAGNGASSNTVPTGGGYIGGAACTQPNFFDISNDPGKSPEGMTTTDSSNATSASAVAQTEQSSITSGRPFVSLPRQPQQPAPSAATTANRTQTGTASSATAPAKARTTAPTTPTANFPVSVGTLQAGESVTILFQVTINDPLPGTVTQISNQGTVSGVGFSNVLTDDPSIAGSANPTITPVAAFAFTVNDVSIAEGAVGQRQAVFTIGLTNAKSTATSVHVQTANGTATAGVDYVALPDTLVTIPANALSTTVTVLVNGDTVFEGNETFFVDLSNATGASILDTQAIGTIADDEPQVGDLSGDGMTDAAIWNSNDGKWYRTNGGTLTLVADDWGRAALGDRAVPGDYDGDNQIDVAVFRASEGNWYILRTSTPGVPLIQNWGQSGDIPVPGDYDGDGKTDIAVFRPSQGNWYILKSSGGNTVQNWGISTDKPVVGDFDGDGKSDLAVFRPNEGNWYVLNSASGTITIQNWGVSTDKLVPGDYDGDGKTDMAIYRNGTWFIRNSNGGAATIKSWGNATDVAVPGDYDGDGKFDIAVWRGSEGKWYIIRSSDNTVLLQTIEIDNAGIVIVPVPNAYLPQ